MKNEPAKPNRGKARRKRAVEDIRGNGGSVQRRALYSSGSHGSVHSSFRQRVISCGHGEAHPRCETRCAEAGEATCCL